MQIASKITAKTRRNLVLTNLATTGFLLALTAIAFPVSAADTPLPPPVAPIASSAAPVSPMPFPPAAATPAISAPTASVTSPNPVGSLASDTKPPVLPGAVEEKNEKGLESVKTKIPDSVKDVLKRLDNTNVVTLEDLNSARQAVARIDALIDIEKHISELQKIRQDREENSGSKSSKTLAAAIPASAIAPPTFMPPPSMMMARNEGNVAPAAFMPQATTEISRIMGGAGHYTAVIKADGANKNFGVGDKLPNGGTIEKITSSDVVVNQNGAKHVLHVKNVDMVFSNTP